MKTKACPMGHGPMELKTIKKKIEFRDVELNVDVTTHVCPTCGMTASDIDSTAKLQRQIADAYRKKKNLITGDEIRILRESRGLSQEKLAELLGVGIASIKRWELGNIQSESMDKLLRTCLKCDCPTDLHTGNRRFSISRIKLVARCFEKKLNKRLLVKGDKFLFLAKYLWYADMVAFRKLNTSMTGATYAALPYGPQLNNYRDLIDEIKNSDESTAEVLSSEEIKIIKKIADKFPYEQMVYDAAHRELVWKKTPTGAMIPYSLSSQLTEM